jgi:hypothetical protein
MSAHGRLPTVINYTPVAANNTLRTVGPQNPICSPNDRFHWFSVGAQRPLFRARADENRICSASQKCDVAGLMIDETMTVGKGYGQSAYPGLGHLTIAVGIGRRSGGNLGQWMQLW